MSKRGIWEAIIEGSIERKEHSKQKGQHVKEVGRDNNKSTAGPWEGKESIKKGKSIQTQSQVERS
jgi:hypothetical protein